MTFPLTWQNFIDYVREVTDNPNSDDLQFKMTHDGRGNAFSPWYEWTVSRVEITQKGSQFVRTAYSTDMKFTGARVGEYNQVEVLDANECRLKPDDVINACKELHIPVPDRGLRPTQITSVDTETGDKRVDTIDPDTGDTTSIEFFDATTESLKQRETIDPATGNVGLLEEFDKDTGELLKSIENPTPGDGRLV
jgi:hypothetical protein